MFNNFKELLVEGINEKTSFKSHFKERTVVPHQLYLTPFNAENIPHIELNFY